MPDRQQQGPAHSNLYDSSSIYGWISILLHWSTAIVIIVLWLIGKSILSAEGELADERRALHVSTAASAWLVILARVIWRLRSGHPRVRGQSLLIHRIARLTHYASLVVLVLMLVSGPLLVWSRGHPVNVFGLVSIPGPVSPSNSLGEFAWGVHSSSALLLFVLVVVHIGGALKHLMFHTDDTIVRMLWPGRTVDEEAAE